MIQEYKYTIAKWYISKTQPHIHGKLDAGLTLSTKRELLWFDSENDFIDKCNELELDKQFE